MRLSDYITLTLPLLLLCVGASQAGLLHRQYREVLQQPEALSPAVVDVRTDQIPVTIVQDDAPVPQVAAQQATPSVEKKSEESVKPVEPAAIASAVETQQAIAETANIAENIAKAVEQDQKLRVADVIAEVERQQDAQFVQEEIKEAIAEENKELLEAAATVKRAEAVEPTVEQQQQPQQLSEVLEAQPAAREPEVVQPAVKAQLVAAEEPAAAPVAVAAVPEAQQPVQVENVNKLKAVAVEDADVAVAESEPVPEVIAVAAEPVAPVDDALNVRQATQATPTQSTTQQNFVQQLIQNSPLGQFINQLTGQNQQAAQQQPAPGQAAADEPATPAPTLPGFLNPQNAITSAQQAVQNAAQTVQNATTQAFQGLQQFATNLGTQFQNTLSNLGGQNQLSTADSTTTRPPGPFQAIISNFVGGNNPPQAAGSAAVAGAAPAQPPQQQGPLQGILSFFQGNRPQTGGAAVAVSAPAAAAPAGAGMIANMPPQSPAIDGIDNKVDVKHDEMPEPEADQAVETDAIVEPEADVNNEVRNSAEVGLDSFEDAHPDELIVVNDDVNQQHEEAVALIAPAFPQYSA